MEQFKSIDTQKLRNDEHFQFHSDFKELVIRFDADTLKITDLFVIYKTTYQKLDEVLGLLKKNPVTEEISDADRQRDLSLSGFIDAVKSAEKHYDPAIQKAAHPVKMLLKQYSGIASRPFNEESAAVHNLVQELKEKYSTQIAAMNLTQWVAKIEEDNQNFISLMENRYTDLAHKPVGKVREYRLLLDGQYRNIVTKINALAIVENSVLYSEFIREQNQRIERAKNILSRRGTGKKKENTEEKSE